MIVDFEDVAAKLFTISKTIANLNQQKTSFAKTINYQISLFMQSLGNIVSNHHDILTIEPSALYKPLNDKQLALLFNTRLRKKR